jgi:hypothetical protein
MEEINEIESVPDARWQEILREEAQRLAQAMKSDEMLRKDLGGAEEFLLNSARDLFRRALERYQQEQADVQPGK